MAWLQILLFWCCCFFFINISYSQTDTIFRGQNLRVGEKLESASKEFRLEFFSLDANKSHYIGIFYNLPSNTTLFSDDSRPVWVANRNNPIPYASGNNLTLHDEGKLKIIYGNNITVLLSSNNATARNTSGNGNFVLAELNTNGSVSKTLWQSFEHPTDTLLPGMKIGKNQDVFIWSNVSILNSQNQDSGRDVVPTINRSISSGPITITLPPGATPMSPSATPYVVPTSNRSTSNGTNTITLPPGATPMPPSATPYVVPTSNQSTSNGPSTISVPPDAAPMSPSATPSIKWWIWLIAAVGLTILVGLSSLYYLRRGKGKAKATSLLLLNQSKNIAKRRKTESQDVQLYSFESLAIATDNFSLGNKLGEGGFGPVYKGELPDGQEVAIKRLSTSSGQGLWSSRMKFY